ncbi:glycosyltransferase family 2 protein [Pseudobutyrivibrio ruminis]|uniref:glycosyltransferase family 2 protein n=1 Tax=Pseudobutyrivibrio ruminis TaxID=46206 RepID=UPI00051B0CBA|nr:glycosyltransferase [Pseudobutyrivibrio ruminis]
MKLSVLIPIYNVDKYLEECLSSIQNISYKDVEIICINDGSTDASKDIIDTFCKTDERFIILDKMNSGYGDSLNRGLDIAKGEYVSILESDDTINIAVLEEMLSIAENKELDIVKANYNLLYEDRIEPFQNFKDVTYNEVFCPTEHWNVFLSAPAIWSAVFKREFLVENKIKFLATPGASYQDTSFMFKCWCNASRVLLINDYLINYRQTNENSSSNSSKKIFDILNETNEMKSYVMRNKKLDILPICMRTKWQSFAWTLNRLINTEDKLLFLLKVHEDIIIDFYEGCFEKTYWDESNWNIVFNIICDFGKIITASGYSHSEKNIIHSIVNNTLNGRIVEIDLSYNVENIEIDKLYVINSSLVGYENIVNVFVKKNMRNYLVL